MDNARENMIIKKTYKESFAAEVEFNPPETPKLNGTIECAFAIRWEKAKILMQNEGLKYAVKTDKKDIN